jgi:cytochrome c-type biogenesis protein CcmF
MIPELGHFSLIIALFLAVCLGVLPILGAARNNGVLMSLARPLAAGQFVFVALAFAALAYAFLHNDFSVVCRGTFQFAIAIALPVCRNLGWA